MRVWVVATVVCSSLLAIGSTAALLFWSQPDSGVRGWLTYEGGPFPAAFDHYREPGSVVAYAQDGSEAATESFDHGEGFTLRLSPGTYRLQPSSGEAQCPELTVDVHRDEYSIVPIVCGVV